MKTIKCIGIVLLIGMFAFSGSAFAAPINDATLNITTDATSFPPGNLIDFPVTIDPKAGQLGGVAFSVTYNAAIFEFGSAASGSLTVEDPTAYCSDAGALTGCVVPDGTDISSTVFCLANPDDTNGVAKIACASASPMTGTIMIKLRVKSDAVEGTPVTNDDVKLGPTNITNSSAGYDTATDLPVLVGVPDDSGVPTDEYTVASSAMESNVSGTVQAGATCAGGTGDLNDDGSINTGDALQLLFFLNGFVTEEDLCGDADLNGDGSISTGDALQILFFLNGFVDSL